MAVRSLPRVLTDWCAQRGVRVVYRDVGWFGFEYEHDTRTVTIATRVSARTRLYFALHECGHALQDARTVGKTRGVTRKLALIAEEIDAWTRGRRLARRLGIRVNRRSWRSIRARALASHVRYLFS